ncbi:sphingosine N-acyltransferase [Dipodascopsis tothii]|uniref:sphingosine N-acyltransferase n=1 Tax=Dipodascopsis tothii TaxID=44089 RepID=UPI0034CFCFCD
MTEQAQSESGGGVAAGALAPEATTTATPAATTTTRTRRTSSVGHIDLGDTAGSALSTMDATASQILKSRNRRRALSNAMPGATAEVSGASRLWISYRELCYRKTWVNPLLALSVPIVAYACAHDKEHSLFRRMLFASYPVAGTNPVQYAKGAWDFIFVGYYVIVFTFLREFSMQQILEPIAHRCGIKRESKVKRFMEQTYSIMYYSVMSPWGLYIMHHTPLWYFETRPFYEAYPHKLHDLDFKMYYLLQAAFWSQQAIILCLQVEKPRKDFKELVFHHVVTIALIFCSYRFHFTWIGLAVYITMDTSDLVLATSKTLNYLNNPITGPFFLFFMCVWVYTRHYLNLRILWSVLTEFATVGDFTLNFAAEQYKCWISQTITFVLLSALQLVNTYWLFLICRVAYRYVFSNIQKDERSSDEEDDEEDEPEAESKKDE